MFHSIPRLHSPFIGRVPFRAWLVADVGGVQPVFSLSHWSEAMTYVPRHSGHKTSISLTCAISHSGRRLLSSLFGTILVLLLPALCAAQIATGSLSGIVMDNSGAVIPGADVTLRDQATNTTQVMKSNGSGNFAFSVVPAGTYTIRITHAGFSAYELSGIVLNEGEVRNVPHIALKPGGESTTVQVSADSEMVPLESGQVQTTLNEQMVSQLSIQGRDAAELIKVLPGMAINSGLGQSEYNSLVTGTATGPVGSFSASGTAPDGGLAMTLDGANITDTGTQGLQMINVNQDQTAQVSILNSAFGAEYAKGPVLFQAISKSGGAAFHGSAYLYARDQVLNATDAYTKAVGFTRPDESYYYPGFTLGGPVLIPKTSFNHNRDKLFFFAGYEYFKQQPPGNPHELFVPTAQMLSGNFSPAYLSTLGQTGQSGVVPCATAIGTYCATSGIVNGQIPQAQVDPDALAYAKLFPAANQNPATNNGFNYVFLDNPPLNHWEARGRLDYHPNSKATISGSYTRQDEVSVNNFGIYYEPGDTLPYPTQLDAARTATFWTGNYTQTIGNSLTNNFIITYLEQNFPLKPVNPKAIDPSTIGFTAAGPFKNTGIAQIPNIFSYSCYQSSTSGCFPGIYGPGFLPGFQNGAFGYTKHAPAITDDLIKVLGRHTLRAGFYWDGNEQIVAQPAAYEANGQGSYDFETYGSNSTGNPVADFLIGHAVNYVQANAQPIQDITFHQYSFYGEDQWKIKNKLTVTYGLRFDHQGQWYPTNSPGFAVWDPSLYNDSPNASSFTGLTWHSKDGSVPLSGWQSRAFVPLPRVGVAYDFTGTGRTVLRGGYGLYLWQVSYNDVQAAFNPPIGVQTVSTPALNSFADAANYQPSAAIGQNGSVNVLEKGDDHTPSTGSWNVTLSQQGPKGSIFEISYVGNRTRDALLTDTSTSSVAALTNINKIPVGALFGPDPVTGITYAPGQVPSSALLDYRPYHNYQILSVTTHGSYSNYNALMTTWQKQKGPVTFTANYTWSKAMGIRDGQTDNADFGNGFATDAFTLHNNYGPLGYDRTHIFNAAYIIQLPSPIHGKVLESGLVNGWQLSGITQLQSGPPIQPNTNGTLNATFAPGVSNQSILGTDSQVLVPTLTCDPRDKKYFNPSCFATPTIGQNGPSVYPDIKGPGYFESDLAMYKTFHPWRENQLQFRFSAFNFLNHAISQCGNGNDVNLVLTGPNGTNSNGSTTGTPRYEVGRRVVELAVKYVF